MTPHLGLDAHWTGRDYDACMHAVPMRRGDAFFVKIWHEGGESAQAPWRAMVQHVASGERRFFTNYGELCEFLDRFRRLQPSTEREF